MSTQITMTLILSGSDSDLDDYVLVPWNTKKNLTYLSKRHRTLIKVVKSLYLVTSRLCLTDVTIKKVLLILALYPSTSVMSSSETNNDHHYISFSAAAAASTLDFIYFVFQKGIVVRCIVRIMKSWYYDLDRNSYHVNVPSIPFVCLDIIRLLSRADQTSWMDPTRF